MRDHLVVRCRIMLYFDNKSTGLPALHGSKIFHRVLGLLLQLFGTVVNST